MIDMETPVKGTALDESLNKKATLFIQVRTASEAFQGWFQRKNW